MISLKLLLGKVLTSTFFFKIFIQPFKLNEIYSWRNFKVDLSNQSNYIKALVYLRLYERAEVALIKKYIKAQYDVIELGASVGITSLAINSVVRHKKVISIEANPLLIFNLKETKKLNKLDNWLLHNSVIDYSGLQKVQFKIDPRNLGSHKASENDDDKWETMEVSTSSLKALYNEYLYGSDFILVCDIEGAEIEFILNESELLINNCRQMIIELHETTYNGTHYKEEDLERLIICTLGMKTKWQLGKTWIFEK